MRIRPPSTARGLSFLVAAVGSSAVSHASPFDSRVAAAEEPACRNATAWPYASSCIWNLPLGSDAAFVPARLFAPADDPCPGAAAFF